MRPPKKTTAPHRSLESTITGRLVIHARGFGFVNAVAPAAGEPLSVFVAPTDLGGFLADDVVTARVELQPDGRQLASDLRLESRPRQLLLGTIEERRGRRWLRPDPEVASSDWPLGTGHEAFRVGDTIVARLEGNTATAFRSIAPGPARAQARVIHRYNLLEEFGPEALAEAERVKRSKHRLGGRRDLRAVPTITVDAPVTRDIDDAISVIPAGRDGALRLVVSIADVAEFVTPGSPLDVQARARGTSVYLADRVLPMLPDPVSSDALSLLEGQERNCLSVELRIDPEGTVTAVDVFESLIRSWARVDYGQTAAFLDRQEVPEPLARVASVLPWFRLASARLGVFRSQRGGVEFLRDEARFSFDARSGAVSGIESSESNSAHRMIERFMVAANEAIATWLFDRGVPTLYRVHPQPGTDRVADLEVFAGNSGFATGFGATMTPRSLWALDAQIAGTAAGPSVRAVMLRTLGPARYTTRAAQHFGLAAPLYLHFTSPLRRYADLEVHRTIKRYLRGDRAFLVPDPAQEELAGHINERARAASRAESDRQRVLAAELMARHIGRSFRSRITRVRPFGLVVHLEDPPVEGLVPVESLPAGPYSIDARETTLSGKGRSFTIGEALPVRIVSTDPVLGRIDLAIDRK
ncbi:MAG: RNB domain-containing ribonuclease [Candidatus Riflebacteria bacterium]|nr:RNB domain-containing ribonuclease [Candidatus Riflebacteria bacterium]